MYELSGLPFKALETAPLGVGPMPGKDSHPGGHTGTQLIA